MDSEAIINNNPILSEFINFIQLVRQHIVQDDIMRQFGTDGRLEQLTEQQLMLYDFLDNEYDIQSTLANFPRDLEMQCLYTGRSLFDIISNIDL